MQSGDCQALDVPEDAQCVLPSKTASKGDPGFVAPQLSCGKDEAVLKSKVVQRQVTLHYLVLSI